MLDKNWISDTWGGLSVSVKTTRHVFSKKSRFQQIDIYDTLEHGRMLVLDGIIQLTEHDEFAYQEIITHIPMFSHPCPQKILVIGGGDGGVLREISKHSTVESIDICEIDAEVITAAKKFLPSLSCGYDDPRVNVHIADGSEFIRDKDNYYDVIIVDSTDPVGPGEALFNEQFYRGMLDALNNRGIITSQSESLFMHFDIVKRLLGICKTLFPVYGYAWMMVPTYPGGNIGVCVGSMCADIRDPVRKPDVEFAAGLRYYSHEIHKAAFVLPKFAREIENGTF